MKNESVRFLNWLLEFARSKIRDASPAEKNRWAAETGAIMTEGLWGSAKYERFLAVASSLGKRQISEQIIMETIDAQEAFAKFSQELLDRIKRVFGPDGSKEIKIEGVEAVGFEERQHFGFQPKIPNQVVVGSRMADKLVEALRVGGEIRELAEILGREMETNLRVTAEIKDIIQNPHIIIHAFSTDAGTSLQIMFLRFLTGVPLRDLKWCSECGNPFIQVTKKKRLFCENRCAARNLARASRSRLKSLSENKYNEQKRAGAKRARKSYEKKLKKKGVKVKPARRPYKHKED